MAAGLLFVLHFHLVPALLAGLLVNSLLHRLTRRLTGPRLPHGVARWVAAGMVALACILSPHRIVLSGGVGRRPGMHEAVNARLEELLAGYMAPPEIAAPALGDRAGVLGSLALVSPPGRQAAA